MLQLYFFLVSRSRLLLPFSVVPMSEVGNKLCAEVSDTMILPVYETMGGGDGTENMDVGT